MALVTFYDLCDVEEFCVETKVAKRFVMNRLERNESDNQPTIEAIHAMLCVLHEAFPNVIKIFKLAMTIGC